MWAAPPSSTSFPSSGSAAAPPPSAGLGGRPLSASRDRGGLGSRPLSASRDQARPHSASRRLDPFASATEHGQEARSATRSSETIGLLRASLDTVAERAGLDRQQVYLWVNNVLPSDIWQPLWDSVTTDLLSRQGSPPSLSGTSGAGTPGTGSPRPFRPGSDYLEHRPPLRPPQDEWNRTDDLPRADLRSAVYGSRDYQEVPLHDDRQRGSPGMRSHDGYSSGALADEWQREDVRLGALSVRSSGTHTPGGHSQVGGSQSRDQAMAAWLGMDGGGCPEMSTMELVEWVKALPPTKLPEDTKKAVARILISRQMTAQMFDEIVSGSDRWSELGVRDKSQQASIARFFKQKKHEVLMAVAAREEHIAQKAFVCNKKGEMFNA